MIGIDQILSPENQTAALASFRLKNDGQGPDGMRVSELDEYWKANGERVTGTIRDGSYRPGILCYDITARSGKLREIANINVKDRLVEKLVQRVLQAAIEPTFLPSSFAYQEGKSALDAAMLARSCVEQGRPYVCEIDLKDYFTTIPHSRLLELLGALGCDETSLELVRQLISRPVEREGKVEVPSKGLLQGSAISPVLANLYLNSFDQYLERRGLSWFRFSDNICAYCQDAFEASEIFEELTGILQGTDYRLTVNTKKSGVYEAINRRVLGYDLVERDGIVERLSGAVGRAAAQRLVGAVEDSRPGIGPYELAVRIVSNALFGAPARAGAQARAAGAQAPTWRYRNVLRTPAADGAPREGDRALAVHIDAPDDGFRLMINMADTPVDFRVPAAREGRVWRRLVDTAVEAEKEDNCWPEGEGEIVADGVAVQPWSVVVWHRNPSPQPGAAR